ncbi:MAG: lytic transglycosylase domain-containing protein [Deltaproteobacteria bacterium]
MPTVHACPRHRTTLSALVCVLMVVAGAGRAWAAAATDAQEQAAVLALASKAIAQDTGGAAALLEPLTVKGGLFSDYALYLTAAANRDNPQTQRQALQRLLSEHPGSPLYGPAMAELAEVLYKLEDFAAVDELSLRPATTDLAAPEAARLWMAAGKALAGRDDAKAIACLLRVRRHGPGSEVSKQAARLVTSLREKDPSLSPRTADQLYREALVEGREGRFAAQIVLLDRFLEIAAHDRRRIDATAARATALARSKSRKAAAAWLQERTALTTEKPARARLLFETAVHYWNGAGGNDQALGTFGRMLALATGIKEEQRAHYATARIHESSRRYTAAAVSYRQAAAGADSSVAAESRWRAGWVSYLAGNFSGAAWVFGRVAERGGRGGPEALYWQARSLEKLEKNGGQQKAASIHARILADHPDSYYAYLSEKRSKQLAPAPKVEAIPAVPATMDASGADTPAQGNLYRARALALAGLDRWASLEVKTALARAPSSAKAAMLAEASRAGAHSEAMRTALALYYGGQLRENQLYPYLYPKAHEEVVRTQALRHGLDPALVWGLMRQESAFDRRAVSPASAYGLMQLLSATAERMARNAGVEGGLTADRLFEADTNIRLGTAYLGVLADLFADNEVLMLAGYNAGERASERWRKQFSGLDEDEFVERISYRETRSYVKKVLRNRRNYQRLYDDTDSARQSLN